MTATVCSPTPDRWDELCEHERLIDEACTPSEAARRWSLTDPGPELARLVAEVDVATLDDVDVTVYAQAVQRQQGWTDHLLHIASVRFAALRPGPEDPHLNISKGRDHRICLGGPTDPVQQATTASAFAAAEWAVVLRTTRGVAQRLLADSVDLAHRLPGLHAYLRIGLCDTWRARLVAEATRDLAPLTVYAVEDEVLPIITTLTRARLQRLIDTIVARLEPDRIAERAQKAKTTRRVDIAHTHDDHADVFATLDSTAAVRLDRRLDTLAKLLGIIQRHDAKNSTDSGAPARFGPGGETWDQRRARALGLLAEPTTCAALIRAVRTITHPGSGIEGIDDQDPADVEADAAALAPVKLYVHLRADGTIDLEGHGVMSTTAAHELLDGSQVTVTPVIDLNTRLVAPGYGPSDPLREQVVLINEHCWFPYCDQPARTADFEHTEAWPRGPTATDNAGPGCRHHHRVKTHGDFELAQPFPGIYAWRTPTGAVHIVDQHGTHTLR